MPKEIVTPKSAAHTPGPWSVEVDGEHLIRAERVTVALVTRGVDAECDDQLRGPTFEANASLIAAAPDFYAAMTVDDIDQIIDGLDNFCIGPVENDELRAIWQPYIDKLKVLRAAILKAEGRS